MSESVNLAVVSGHLSSEPRHRDLPSGSSLLNLEITVSHDDRRSDTVPVSMFDPPIAASRLVEGDEVVVCGSVRRRFFRAGGATVSRTEIVAESITAPRRRATIRRVVGRVRTALEPFVAD